jgi:hypothetical protein
MAARKFTASKLPLAFRGKGGASSTYLTLLGLQRSRLTLTEGLKRFGGDRKGIGCALIKLSPDRSMKPQRDVWLIALPNGGNLLPSDAISQAVKLNVSRSCFLLSPSYSPRLLRNNSLGLSRSHPDRASASMCSPNTGRQHGGYGTGAEGFKRVNTGLKSPFS